VSIDEEKLFSKYLILAVEKIHQEYSCRGYDSAAYTHDLRLSDEIVLKATKPPYTMCVAAQMEIIVTALNLYGEETNDRSYQSYLPINEWTKLKGKSFKSMIWLAEGSGSNGTADALARFGMGKVVSFSELVPGSFINLNRTSGSGHATLFLGYINNTGKHVPKFDESVVGFKYYSSQGKLSGGGMDYRLAFFDSKCPDEPTDIKRDCGVIYSDKQKYLNCGVMYSPSFWDKVARNAALMNEMGDEGLELPDSYMNPLYLNQTTADDK